MEMRSVALAISFFTAGCSSNNTLPLRASPIPSSLSAQLAAPCPQPPALTDRSIGEVGTKDNDLAEMYNACAARHAGVVNAYKAARDEAVKWNEDKH